MLGIKSNREPVKGDFAKKLREQISSGSPKAVPSQRQAKVVPTEELEK